MTFDRILENNTLWAVRYDGDEDNALRLVFNQWNDPEWLWDFFTENMTDLESYFRITDLNQAIYDTMDDSGELECLILDISPEADLDRLFLPLENSRTAEMTLGKEKARLHDKPAHASWLRLYAIKLEKGVLHHHRRCDQAHAYDARAHSYPAKTPQNGTSPQPAARTRRS